VRAHRDVRGAPAPAHGQPPLRRVPPAGRRRDRRASADGAVLGLRAARGRTVPATRLGNAVAALPELPPRPRGAPPRAHRRRPPAFLAPATRRRAPESRREVVGVRPILLPLLEHGARRSIQRSGGTTARHPSAAGRLHIYDIPGTGHAPPTVLLHGITATAVSFAPL